MTKYLLDANVLIALVVGDHEHHERASRWASTRGDLAVCPITEGALVRFLLRVGVSASAAQKIVRQVHARTGVDFWPDAVSYADISLAGVIGHRQATDAYLASLARSRGAQIATLDSALATAAADVAVLMPDEETP